MTLYYVKFTRNRKADMVGSHLYVESTARSMVVKALDSHVANHGLSLEPSGLKIHHMGVYPNIPRGEWRRENRGVGMPPGVISHFPSH